TKAADYSTVVYCGTILFFFFQAEDGIRDRNVTGVQTCALPISPACAVRGPGASPARGGGGQPSVRPPDFRRRRCRYVVRSPLERSEERRVGKECRCGRAP